ncbi:MAG: hypothetical protein IT160_15575 [Bryobacterales bacterium]|nr:hypothetical protein [Bryobacterales bacterium]
MNRRDLLKLPLAGAAPLLAQPDRFQIERAVPRQTTLPSTYIIDYATNHLADPGFIARAGQAPPCLLHLGHDVPFTGHWGPRPLPLPVADLSRYRQLTPAETHQRIRALKDMVTNLHGAGARIIFPYIDSQQMGGDIEKRLGFWEFYDSWDQYRDFGLHAKPTGDPALWLQRDPAGEIHFNNPAAYPGYAPQYFYAPCPNNENWRNWLAFVVRQIASTGFDGVFVDDNIIHCYCRYCREGFARYLRSRYSPDELKAAFGESDADKISLNSDADKVWWAKSRPEFLEFLTSRFKPGELEKRFQIPNLTMRSNFDRIGSGFLDGQAGEFIAAIERKYTPAERRRQFGVANLHLLGIERPQDRLRWFETQRFWAWSIAELLVFLGKSLPPHIPRFTFVPNWGAMQTVRAVDGRRRYGKNVAEWKRGADFMMFEEDYVTGMPGRAAAGGFTSHLAQYKFALANGARPVVLSGGPHGKANIELAHAEAAAGGCGAWVQGGYAFPEVRRTFRRLYESRPELFAGMTSLAGVAVAYFFNQLHLENIAHLEQVYAIHPQLAGRQVLFDFLTEGTLGALSRYRVLILPSVKYLSAGQAHSIERWRARGGLLIVTGGHPAFDDLARPLAKPLFAGAETNLARAMAPRFRWTTQPGVPGLRANAYSKTVDGGTLVTVHVLNYDISPSGEVFPAKHAAISLPLPPSLSRLKVKAATTLTAGGNEDELPGVIVRDGRLHAELPDIQVYRIVSVTLSPDAR